jgi:murein DD-endopeptidase MepM/ murein hydrolase activator NlpD
LNTLSRVQRFIRRTDSLLQRHPRRLTAIVVAGLLTTAVTAFGVAPLAPDAADLPRSIVTQSVMPSALDAQLQALETHALELYRNDLTRSSDTADSLLRRLGVDDPQAAAFLRKDTVARKLLEGRPGKMVQVLTHEGRLSALVARSPAEAEEQFSTHFTRLTVTRDALGLRTISEQVPLASDTRLASGTIQTSLFAAADESRVPEPVTAQLADLFGTDIDFRRELRRGDTFTVLYEALTADGEPVTWNQASGRVLAAQFVNAGKVHDAVWFAQAAPGGKIKGGYFGLDGLSKTRMFLPSPMAFSRVTSGFKMRFHPILNSWRAHLGVDYGAPTGTAVRTVGEGVVEFSGRQNGYGNIVIIKHAGDRETRYAHLSRLDVRRGQRVEQGQRIGAVGATGWATGPHLHFEFRVRGVHVDPMTIARASEAMTLSPASRERFTEAAEAARVQLAAAGAVAEASFE